MNTIYRTIKLIPIMLFGLVLIAGSPVAMGHSAFHTSSTPEASPMAHGSGNTGTGAVYMEIMNDGDEADTLIAAETEVAEIVEIHSMRMEGDTMEMFELEDGLEVPASETVTLESGGFHIMLINLTKSLHEGDEFTLTLTFEHAGDVEVLVPVTTEAPSDDAITEGDLEIRGVWSRPAPMISRGDSHSGDSMGTPVATPESHS